MQGVPGKKDYMITTITIEPALYKEATEYARARPDIRSFAALIRKALRAELKRGDRGTRK